VTFRPFVNINTIFLAQLFSLKFAFNFETLFCCKMRLFASIEKNIKLFHTLTFAEIVDNLANSIVVLFTQIYTLDINGLAKSQDNYIYYGFTLIMMYIILTVTWQNIQS